MIGPSQHFYVRLQTILCLKISETLLESKLHANAAKISSLSDGLNYKIDFSEKKRNSVHDCCSVGLIFSVTRRSRSDVCD